jgi:hypothetical protein
MVQTRFSGKSKVPYLVPGLGHYSVALSEVGLEARDNDDPDTLGDPNEPPGETRWKYIEEEYKGILQADYSVLSGRV